MKNNNHNTKPMATKKEQKLKITKMKLKKVCKTTNMKVFVMYYEFKTPTTIYITF